MEMIDDQLKIIQGAVSNDMINRIHHLPDKKQRSRQVISLDETLIAWAAINRLPADELAKKLGRGSHALDWMFFTGKFGYHIKNRLEVRCRSMLRFFYEDDKDIDNDRLVDFEQAMSRLFAHFGKKYLGGEKGLRQINMIIDRSIDAKYQKTF